MSLTAAERDHLDAAVAQVEVRAGAQVVVASVPKSDAYPELPWVAFACATALAALAGVLAEMFRPGWVTGTTHLFVATTTLGAGALAALAAIFLPSFARLFLRRPRAEGEARQQAQSLFLERELHATRERCTVLLLMSEFERQIVILPDKAVRDCAPDAAWQRVIDAMRSPLAQGRHAAAIEAGLAALEAVLLSHGVVGDGRSRDELPNGVIETKGA